MNATQPAQPSPPARRTRVAVLFGGRSGEHTVSCLTAGSVMSAIDRELYEVIPIGVTRRGEWVLVDPDPQHWQLRDGVLPEVRAEGLPSVSMQPAVGRTALSVLEAGQPPRLIEDIDVVFPLLHGAFGEDGTVQGLLELGDVRYVGSGVLASAMAMDKHVTKTVLAAAGLPVTPCVVVTSRRWELHADEVRDDVEELGYPVFVKPARSGSSLGVTKVKGPADLDSAIEFARREDPKVLVEPEIEGRELECGVLAAADGGTPSTSLVGEMHVSPSHEFHDFEVKYLDPALLRIECPADLPESVSHRVRELAARAFEVLGCEGLARVDFFLPANGRPILNEVNTMPGFTPTSAYPQLWQATGLAYRELVDRLLRLALSRPTGLR